MKKIIRTIREYPHAMLLFIIADLYITERYAKIAAVNEPTQIKYYIELYGGLLAVLLFITGWMIASGAAAKKEEERRRMLRRKAIYESYSREFYGVTEK